MIGDLRKLGPNKKGPWLFGGKQSLLSRKAQGQMAKQQMMANAGFGPAQAQMAQAIQMQKHQAAMMMKGQQMAMAGAANYTIIPNMLNSTTSSTTTLSGTFGNVYNTYVTTGSQGTSNGLMYTAQNVPNVVANPGPPSLYGASKVAAGHHAQITLPDGTVVDVKIDGSFEIIDKDAKVTYRASRCREFNRFINASDQIEGFIRYCAEMGISKQDMLELPLNTFIAWLVVEAAKADQEPEPDVPLLADLRKIRFPRCIQCQKFIPHDYPRKRLEFCKPLCFDRYQRRLTAPPQPKLLEAA